MLGKRRAFFFGITMSEIAFILFFAILLFAFFRFGEDAERIEASELDLDECRIQLVLINELQDKIRQALNDPEMDQDEVIRRMVEVDRLTTEIIELEKLVETLQEEMDDYESIRNSIDQAAQDASKSEVDPTERMRRALVLLDKLEMWIRIVVPSGTFDSPEEAQAFALKAAEDKLAAFQDAENKDFDPTETIEDVRKRLAGKEDQLEFCMNQLNECRGGRDLPPCWVNADNPREIDFLLKIDLHDDGLEIQPGDEPSRRNDFQAVPGASDLVGSRVGIGRFKELAQVVFDHSDSLKCRHYVLITDQSEHSYKSTLTIEEYFYKVVRN